MKMYSRSWIIPILALLKYSKYYQKIIILAVFKKKGNLKINEYTFLKL